MEKYIFWNSLMRDDSQFQEDNSHSVSWSWNFEYIGCDVQKVNAFHWEPLAAKPSIIGGERIGHALHSCSKQETELSFPDLTFCILSEYQIMLLSVLVVVLLLIFAPSSQITRTKFLSENGLGDINLTIYQNYRIRGGLHVYIICELPETNLLPSVWVMIEMRLYLNPRYQNKALCRAGHVTGSYK